MSMHGLTIDYGPFGFLEEFDQDYACNHSDKEGRYSYKNQPEMCKWNLIKLAEALDPVLPKRATIEYVKQNYDQFFRETYDTKMVEKLGLKEVDDERSGTEILK